MVVIQVVEMELRQEVSKFKGIKRECGVKALMG